jgi:NADPH-dependent 7-cyano-7-deazaguanine reductase QueF
MIVKYNLKIKCKCPVDGFPDVYTAEITSDRAVPVEEILQRVKVFEDRKMFQEQMTEELARMLSCRVCTVGWHSGVETEVVA